ncbi:MAG: hypothetical protein ABUL60_22085 [Myxococcales bacterium]
MKLVFCAAVGLWGALWAGGCSDSKGPAVAAATAGADGEGAASNGNGGEPATASDDACHDGCVATIAAACSNGPTDQASCESTCHSLATGKCGGEYVTLQSCAEGKAVTCGSGALEGLPVVTECSDEQAAFIACING